MDKNQALHPKSPNSEKDLERVNQVQQELYAMHKQTHQSETRQNTEQPIPINESPYNVVQSWHKLRELDEDLAEHKYKDMANDSGKEIR
ncbi:hypothetical protein [Pontibacter vulgaris]|uniref:hypothetical protein n=1 Tax=Pontibacter vulgaris TaxID=2905679 RepID=UPI001FA6F32A|nr:hypothetical protein [Pontibacter vulgaris]